jgi:hypothetical protein
VVPLVMSFLAACELGQFNLQPPVNFSTDCQWRNQVPSSPQPLCRETISSFD